MAAKRRVLIIDDDPALRRLLQFGLTRAGYEVLTAAQGAEGMALLGQGPVDLVLVDLMMPVVDGLGFLRWFRQEAGATVPALVFTSYDRHNATADALALGASEVLVKPVQLPALVERVKRLLGD
jgi:DNA-binding response OmpR family regulator